MNKFSDFNIQAETSSMKGDKVHINKLVNTEIEVHRFEIKPSKYKNGQDCLHLQIIWNGEHRVLFIGSKNLISMVTQLKPEQFPFKTTIIMDNGPKFS